MTQPIYSPAADADVRSIWDYTAEHWSEEQADRYVDDIRDACRDLAAGHKRGRPVPVRRAGYLKYRVESHLIYYRLEDAGLVVVRVLHTKMDAERHLN